MSDNNSVMQDDIQEMLDALGLDTGARPYSPHRVVQDEILPAIRELKAEAEGSRRAFYTANQKLNALDDENELLIDALSLDRNNEQLVDALRMWKRKREARGGQ